MSASAPASSIDLAQPLKTLTAIATPSGVPPPRLCGSSSLRIASISSSILTLSASLIKASDRPTGLTLRVGRSCGVAPGFSPWSVGSRVPAPQSSTSSGVQFDRACRRQNPRTTSKPPGRSAIFRISELRHELGPGAAAALSVWSFLLSVRRFGGFPAWPIAAANFSSSWMAWSSTWSTGTQVSSSIAAAVASFFGGLGSARRACLARPTASPKTNAVVRFQASSSSSLGASDVALNGIGRASRSSSSWQYSASSSPYLPSSAFCSLPLRILLNAKLLAPAGFVSEMSGSAPAASPLALLWFLGPRAPLPMAGASADPLGPSAELSTVAGSSVSLPPWGRPTGRKSSVGIIHAHLLALMAATGSMVLPL